MHKRTMPFRAALALLCLLAAAACSADPTQAPGATAEPTTDRAGYPASEGYPVSDGYPVEGEDPPYPIEDGEADAFEENLTPVAPPPEVTADTGAFSLKLFYAATGDPVRGQLFFAAEMLPVEGMEDSYVPKLHQASAPSGSSDSGGQVHISTIPPGKYSLAVITPLGPVLVEQQGTQEPITFDIIAGEVTDLGTAEVTLNADVLEP